MKNSTIILICLLLIAWGLVARNYVSPATDTPASPVVIDVDKTPTPAPSTWSVDPTSGDDTTLPLGKPTSGENEKVDPEVNEIIGMLEELLEETEEQK